MADKGYISHLEPLEFSDNIKEAYLLSEDECSMLNCECIEEERLEDMIREKCEIYCEVISTKSWHRYNGYDQQFAVIFQVLPPEE